MSTWNQLIVLIATYAPLELPFVLPIVASSVGAIIRQDGFTPQWNAFIAWAAVLLSAAGVAWAEGALVGDPLHVASAFCAIGSLLISGALHSLDPYLAYLGWVQSHVLDVFGPTVAQDFQKKVAIATTPAAQGAANPAIAAAIQQAAASWQRTKAPQPIVLPKAAHQPQSIAGSYPAPPPHPQEQPIVVPPPSSAVVPAIDLNQLTVTYPMAALNKPPQQ